ncbi:MAG: glutathione S-transferase [Thermoleophilaceae bacterium]|nr:glutathione S-transferase [Thermoleophilaceae bacterium]
MELTLYVIPGAHPSACAEAAVRLKGLPYRRVAVPPVIHRFYALRASLRRPRFPMLRVDGRYICHNVRIMRELDLIAPDPPLLPSDPERRAAVEAAERWGDAVLQAAARRIAWAAFNRNRAAVASYLADGSLLAPRAALRAGVAPAAQIARLAHRAFASRVRQDLAELPAMLDRVDAWIADGTLDAERPTAADLQIGSSVRILSTFADVRPWLDGRPCDAHARRLFPRYPGEMPAGTLPAAWVG